MIIWQWMKRYGLHHGAIALVYGFANYETMIGGTCIHTGREFGQHFDDLKQFDTKAWLDMLVPWVCAPIGRYVALRVGWFG